MSDRVTVVIPTRNRWRLLKQTLGTVMAQEGVDFDVVIVDEGSTDETPEMLRQLPRERVHVPRHDQAKGVSATRNAGIAAATGEWVAFVDDDYIWAPHQTQRPAGGGPESPRGRVGCAAGQ